MNPYNQQEIKLRHFVAKLTTEAKENSYSQETIDKEIKAFASENNLHETYVRFRYNDRSRISVPYKALNDIATIAQKLLNDYAEHAQFPFFVDPANRSMYIALLILGANGRTFVFSRKAAAEAFHTNDREVGNFLFKMKRSQTIMVVRSGVETGGPTYYALNDDNTLAWLDIGAALNVPDTTSTEDLIRDRFGWLFDKSNPCNDSSFKEEFLATRQPKL